jgi:hypothetical protein
LPKIQNPNIKIHDQLPTFNVGEVFASYFSSSVSGRFWLFSNYGIIFVFQGF